MTPRERYLAALTFGNPDKIPFSPGGGRESTRARWHTEGLPEGKNPTAHLMEVLGIEPEPARPNPALGVRFIMIPQFEEKVLERKEGHLIVQDWKGNICEISDEFDVSYLRSAKDFCTRRWIRCPVEGRDDWEQMKQRYRLDTPGRFPDDLEQRCARLRERDAHFGISFPGPFWQMREWCGFEGLCMMMIENPALVADMAKFWEDFIAALLERIFARVVPDEVHYSEDMAFKAKSMISPAMAREFCKPRWDRWTKMAEEAGVPIRAIDSDGFIGELIPIWIESGVNACDPIEVAAHNDINEFRARFGRQMGYRGGVDKRAMAKGGQVLRDELKRIEPVVKDGGYIPSCDHGIPSDVSWPNFVDYARLLAKMTGWL